MEASIRIWRCAWRLKCLFHLHLHKLWPFVFFNYGLFREYLVNATPPTVLVFPWNFWKHQSGYEGAREGRTFCFWPSVYFGIQITLGISCEHNSSYVFEGFSWNVLEESIRILMSTWRLEFLFQHDLLESWPYVFSHMLYVGDILWTQLLLHLLKDYLGTYSKQIIICCFARRLEFPFQFLVHGL